MPRRRLSRPKKHQKKKKKSPPFFFPQHNIPPSQFLLLFLIMSLSACSVTNMYISFKIINFSFPISWSPGVVQQWLRIHKKFRRNEWLWWSHWWPWALLGKIVRGKKGPKNKIYYSPHPKNTGSVQSIWLQSIIAASTDYNLLFRWASLLCHPSPVTAQLANKTKNPAHHSCQFLIF